MKTLIAFAMLLAAPMQAGGGTIYDKALAPGWQNWSWARTELSADIGSAQMPILVDAQGYGGLFLHHDPFSTKPYRGLSLLIQPVGGPVRVRVMVTVGGKGVPDGGRTEGGQPVYKYKLVQAAPGGWTKVAIPLGEMGGENIMIDGIQVMNDSADPAPHFYVADIKLM